MIETTFDELADRIYVKTHRAAIDLIIEARERRDTVDWAVIESAVERYAPSDFQSDSHSQVNSQVFFCLA